MKFRPHHLACLILLLSSLSSAEASLRRTGDFTLGGHYISLLLAQDHAATCSEAALAPRARDLSLLALPGASLAHHRTAWTMRPPSAHSLELQAVTSFAA
jgi:hypothetical protein